MLSIPERLRNGFTLIPDLDEPTRKQISDSIASLENPEELPVFADQLSGSTTLSNAQATDVARTIISTFGQVAQYDDVDVFSEELAEALRLDFEWDDKQVEDCVGFLVSVVDEAAPFRVRFKGFSLARDRTNLFTDAHLVTDLRPVFDLVGEPTLIECFMVLHTLHIDFYDRSSGDGNEHSIRIAVDDQDLEVLEEVIKRARGKSKLLREKIEPTEWNLLDV